VAAEEEKAVSGGALKGNRRATRQLTYGGHSPEVGAPHLGGALPRHVSGGSSDLPALLVADHLVTPCARSVLVAGDAWLEFSSLLPALALSGGAAGFASFFTFTSTFGISGSA